SSIRGRRPAAQSASNWSQIRSIRSRTSRGRSARLGLVSSLMAPPLSQNLKRCKERVEVGRGWSEAGARDPRGGPVLWSAAGGGYGTTGGRCTVASRRRPSHSIIPRGGRDLPRHLGNGGGRQESDRPGGPTPSPP